jgi:hypothetical protein
MAIPYLLTGDRRGGTWLADPDHHRLDHPAGSARAVVRSDDASGRRRLDNLLAAWRSVRSTRPSLPQLTQIHVLALNAPILAPWPAHVVTSAGFIGCISKSHRTRSPISRRARCRCQCEARAGIIKRWVEKKSVAVFTSTRIESIVATKDGQWRLARATRSRQTRISAAGGP